MAFASGSCFPLKDKGGGPKEDVTGMRMTWDRSLDRVFHYMQDMQLDAGANCLLD